MVPALSPWGTRAAWYYKDEEKTAKTAKPWVACIFYPGRLSGRRRRHIDLARTRFGIQLAGEKICPEEVEKALKLHDSVGTLVVGVPDEMVKP